MKLNVIFLAETFASNRLKKFHQRQILEMTKEDENMKKIEEIVSDLQTLISKE